MGSKAVGQDGEGRDAYRGEEEVGQEGGVNAKPLKFYRRENRALILIFVVMGLLSVFVAIIL